LAGAPLHHEGMTTPDDRTTGRPDDRTGFFQSLFRRVGRAVSAAPVEDDVSGRRAFITGKLLMPMLGKLTEPLERAQAAAERTIAVEAHRASRTTAQGIARTFPVLRPPGAVAEPDFLAGCTRCSDCIEACPYQAITKAPERMRALAGTPIIDAAAQPCLMCPDTPCITACKPAVLRRAPDAPVPVIGTARIQQLDCLAHQGSTCSSCHERCPVPGAISLVGPRPTVVPELCTGCGLCAHVCPAPRNAVIMVPRIDRPSRPMDGVSLYPADGA